MAEVFNINDQVSRAVNNLGRAAFHNLYPRDLEYYMCALELTTSEGDTIDYFSFPVMPSNIQKTEQHRVSYYHGLNSTVVLNTDTHTPGEITLSGDFGRTFKVVFGNLGKEILKFKGISYSRESGVYTHDDVGDLVPFKVPDFNATVKSGYGCIKILQSMVSKAKGQVDGKSFRLYFYNPALGESYLVVPTKTPLIVRQDESKNMIWGYTLNLTILAPLEKILNLDKQVRTLARTTGINVIQKGVNDVAGSLIKYLQ